VAAVKQEVDTSIVLSQESVSSFDEAKKLSFRQAVAWCLVIPVSHVMILRVEGNSKLRSLSADQSKAKHERRHLQQVAGSGIKVVFEIHADSKKEAIHIVEEIQANSFAQTLAERLDKVGVAISASEKKGLTVAPPTMKAVSNYSNSGAGGSGSMGVTIAILGIFGMAGAGTLMFLKHRRKLAARYREKQAATFSGNVILDPDLEDTAEAAPLMSNSIGGEKYQGNVVHENLA
jgi:hypothetical protein